VALLYCAEDKHEPDEDVMYRDWFTNVGHCWLTHCKHCPQEMIMPDETEVWEVLLTPTPTRPA